MGRQIIKQPDGPYAVWSSVVDDFVMLDCLLDDIIEDWVSEERERIKQAVNRVADALDAGERPYFQFTKSWDEAIATIRRVHGDKSETWALLEELNIPVPLPSAQ